MREKQYIKVKTTLLVQCSPATAEKLLNPTDGFGAKAPLEDRVANIVGKSCFRNNNRFVVDATTERIPKSEWDEAIVKNIERWEK